METNAHPYNSYFNILKPALISKVEEFVILGYDDVNKEDVWNFLTTKKWKKHKEGIRMYELVSDVLSMSVGEYMNFATIEAYKSPNWFTDLNEDELQELLHPKG